MQYGGIPAEVAVHGAELLGVIGGEAHEDQQTNAAQHNVKDAEVAHKQHAEHRDNEQSKETAHQFGAPAGEVLLGAHAVDGHDAEIERAYQEGKNQRRQVIHHKVDAEVDAGEYGVGKEHGRCGAGADVLDVHGEHCHENEFRNGQYKDDTAGIQRDEGTRHHRGKSHTESDEQAGKHPAESPGHILAEREERALRVNRVLGVSAAGLLVLAVSLFVAVILLIGLVLIPIIIIRSHS